MPRSYADLADLALTAERCMQKDRAIHASTLGLFRNEASGIDAQDLVQRFEACIAHSRMHYGIGIRHLGNRRD